MVKYHYLLWQFTLTDTNSDDKKLSNGQTLGQKSSPKFSKICFSYLLRTIYSNQTSVTALLSYLTPKLTKQKFTISWDTIFFKIWSNYTIKRVCTNQNRIFLEFWDVSLKYWVTKEYTRLHFSYKMSPWTLSLFHGTLISSFLAMIFNFAPKIHKKCYQNETLSPWKLLIIILRLW